MLIENQPGMTVAGEASNCRDAISTREQADIVLLDLDFNDEMSLAFLPELRSAAGEVPILILTSQHDRETQLRAIRLGAMGVVFKEKPPEVLIKAIEKVYAGEVWLGRSMVAVLFREMSHPRSARQDDAEMARIATLTQREREVVNLICQGNKHKQVAERLFISETTVRHHLTSIFDKLGVSDRFELVFYAYRRGLASLQLWSETMAEKTSDKPPSS
jgi:DNA-binding NarL/FixJ family response regulator